MQEVRVDEETVLYQEQGDGIYDTLILYKAFNPETSLSAYVQKSINQLKIQGTKLTKEQTKKTELWGQSSKIPAILKTYSVQLEQDTLAVAQLFITQGNSVLLLSYASEDEKNTKAFVKQLSSLQLTF